MKTIIKIIILLTSFDLGIKGHLDEIDEVNFPISTDIDDLSIKKARNYGLPLGFMSEQKNVVLYLPMALIAYLFSKLLMFNKTSNIADKLSISLLLSGGLSNLIDRLNKGYVVDYLQYNKKTLDKLIFNLGDLYIVLGSSLYMLSNTFRLLLKKKS